MEKLRLYVKESYNELMHNVTWPTYASLQSNTILVLIGSFVFAAIILLMDFVCKSGMDLIYGKGL